MECWWSVLISPEPLPWIFNSGLYYPVRISILVFCGTGGLTEEAEIMMTIRRTLDFFGRLVAPMDPDANRGLILRRKKEIRRQYGQFVNSGVDRRHRPRRIQSKERVICATAILALLRLDSRRAIALGVWLMVSSRP